MNNLLNIKTPAESIAQLRKADYNLSNQGVGNLRLVYWNLTTEALYEEAVFRGEGATVAGGPFVANTGKHTARSANDKFVVRETDSEGNVWWGVYNRPIAADKFEVLYLHLPVVCQETGHHRQHGLCGRDQEIGLYHFELSAAAGRRALDALLGQRQPAG